MSKSLRTIKIIVIFFMICLTSKLCMAKEFDMDFFGFSYHFNKAGADKDAPMRLDHAGLWVFNSGVGLGYDFRKDIHTGGLSPIIQGGFFYNCANFPFFYAGAGGRYRKFFFKNFFFDANLLAVFTEGNDWDSKDYKPDAMPFANLGFGYDFGKYLAGIDVSYVPEGVGGTITSGTSMLLINMQVSF